MISSKWPFRNFQLIPKLWKLNLDKEIYMNLFQDFQAKERECAFSKRHGLKTHILIYSMFDSENQIIQNIMRLNIGKGSWWAKDSRKFKVHRSAVFGNLILMMLSNFLKMKLLKLRPRNYWMKKLKKLTEERWLKKHDFKKYVWSIFNIINFKFFI